jgi:subtilisin-like proprotein convertase family protein
MINSKSYLLLGTLLCFFLSSCSSVADLDSIDNKPHNSKIKSNLYDSDNDFIPNIIEEQLGMNPYNSDENDNNILDGLDTDGQNGDTFFNMQWYLYAQNHTTHNGTKVNIGGNDLNLLNIYSRYMGYNNGDNIIIQVVDSGVYPTHPDLIENIDKSKSYSGDRSGLVKVPTDPHGTKVAGVIAARAFNAQGVRGIIPFAKIASSDWLINRKYYQLDKSWVSGVGANEIAISNNSWGSDFDTDTILEEYMKEGSRVLRDYKGRIYVFASGNSRREHGDANLQYVANSRFPIVTASLNFNNRITSYSTPGANVLVSAYGGENFTITPTIATTTIPGTSVNSGDRDTQTTWDEDYNQEYTYDFSGTSAAVPMVSASIGLVLEACPNLTWRDVRYLLVNHAKQIDSSNSSWIENSVGLKHSKDYGFGLINPQGMIDECSNGYKLLPIQTKFRKIVDTAINIPDNKSVVGVNINITTQVIVEWVEVTVKSDHVFASDLKIVLISPSGTRSTLIDVNPISGKSTYYSTTSDWMSGGFRFSTALMIGESSRGTWRVEVSDESADDRGILNSVMLNIYGH